MARKLRSINRRSSCINHAINRLSVIVAIFHTLASHNSKQKKKLKTAHRRFFLFAQMPSQINGCHEIFQTTQILTRFATPSFDYLFSSIISFAYTIQHSFFFVVLFILLARFAAGEILIQETFWRCKLFKNANATLLVVIVLKIVECESHAAVKEGMSFTRQNVN